MKNTSFPMMREKDTISLATLAENESDFENKNIKRKSQRFQKNAGKRNFIGAEIISERVSERWV